MLEAPNQFSKDSTNYFYVFVFLEERIIRIASLVNTVKLHVVEAIRIFGRISKEFAHHSPTDLVSKLVLFLVKELHLLLFSDLLELGPMVKVIAIVMVTF